MIPCLLHAIAGVLSAIVCFQLGVGTAAAEKRVALVIGNSAYLNTRALPNPRNDAEAIARLLGANGFADVTLKADLDYRAMRLRRQYGACHGVRPAGSDPIRRIISNGSDALRTASRRPYSAAVVALLFCDTAFGVGHAWART